jgi:3-dehydroquinate synthase
MKRIRVNLRDRSYGVNIGSGILAQTGSWLKTRGLAGRLVVITNPVVRSLYAEALERSLAGEGFTALDFLEVPDGEEQKSLETAGRLYLEMERCLAERMTPVVALGGGVIGDLAGFVAATYKRGVPLVHIPTTLLAQVDSSIGGKVAVDHGQLKNEIGVFYQPWLVISDIATLKTLDAKTLGDGLAEVIKYGVIRDRGLLAYLEANLARIKAFDEPVLEKIVSRSVEIKAEIVSRDEYDLRGLRAILNYGHTIGHAIESVSGFQVGHGEAVAIGMLAAARISRQMGILGRRELGRLESLLEKVGLPTRIPDLEVESLVSAMQHDKKVSGGKVRFVLPRELGRVFITDDVDLSLVRQVLAD